MSKAVSSNAGSFGRQAAVVAVATGLVTSIGLPALAANADSTAAQDATRTTSDVAQTVSAAKNLNLKFEQAAATSTVEVNEVAAQAEKVEPVAPAASKPATASQTTQTPQAEAKAETAKAPAVSGNLSGVAASAYAGIGHAYVYGGTSPVTGWDCSGFVQWAYAQAGISIPRTNQWGVMVQTSTPKPGDLVVQNGGSHVAIYVGNGMEIGALNPSDGTQLTAVNAVGSAVFYTMP
ncbi:glycoside hydrolase [Psychromicrobium lacuslunae]|uniref:Glycoside hydrolase n=1 Tax=Psychromicrobium lacuslunae TaxID=1618207 RepID=A0A0D4C4B2_9MICC|nr:glycoside hydrolase [Psychromicrobium lacuslunae]